MKMTEDEFRRIYRYVKSRYGINMEKKKEIVQGRLENYVTLGGWKDFHMYMDAVEADSSGQLEKRLLGMLTTNHTYFMREFDHFEFLQKKVLPELKQKEARTRDLGIWCAAASSGEEPYMLAMVLMDFFGLEHDRWDTTILATDVSAEILQQAAAGIYTNEQMEAVPEQWRRRYFMKLQDGVRWEVRPEIKREILFRRFNLMDPFPFKRRFHVIFLRNVMIYFDQATKETLIRKIYDSLETGGYLFIGRTETIDRAAAPFRMIQPSIFQK